MTSKFGVLLLLLQAIFLAYGQICTTPDRQTGSCLKIRSCKQMLDALDRAPKPIPPRIRTLLKSYQCGFEGKSPKICCPSTPIYFDEPSHLDPPDVSRHKNLNLLPKNCGHLDTTEKIVHGNKTGPLEFPWMALLSYQTQSGAEFKCGGTIINNRYILTAAHCVANLKYKLIGVRVGEHDLRTKIDCQIDEYGDETCNPPYQDLAIEKIIPHPQYDARAFSYDIGLLRIKPAINLTLENSRPVCLPLEEARLFNFTGRQAIVTGWGATETGRSSPELLKVGLPVIPIEECKEKYKKIATLNHRQMCAGGVSKSDSCSGDSGGPLHTLGKLHGEHRFIQQGVVSFGPRNCGVEPLPGVYTRVAFYMNWILDNLKP